MWSPVCIRLYNTLFLYWLLIIQGCIHFSWASVFEWDQSGDCYSGWRWALFSTPSWRRCSLSWPWFCGRMATLISQTWVFLKCLPEMLLKISWTFDEIWNTSLPLLQLEITGTAIWINPFIGVLTIISLWPVAIIFMNTNRYLRGLNMVPKYAMYQVSQHNHYHIYGIFIFSFILSGCEENLFVYFDI